MKQCIVLLVAIAFICTAAYGQDEEGGSQAAAFQFDQDRLLKRFAALKPFKPEPGEPGASSPPAEPRS